MKASNRVRVIQMIGISLLIGILNQASAQTTPAVPPVPPPGQMIDIGGWKLHLNCSGQKSDPEQPTVILEAGAGGFSVDWSLVQPQVAKFARVCSYDRAGLGWSELGPHPRTLQQVVWELHTLLEKAGVKPPLIFVGHSYGGILARLYAFTYPLEVKGIVFSDSGHERGVQVLREGKLVRLVETAKGNPVPEVKTSGPLLESDIPPAILEQIRAAAKMMVPGANDYPRNKLPEDAQRMRSWAFGQIKHWASNDNPSEGEELALLLSKWTKPTYPFGNMPIVLISRSQPDVRLTEEEEEHRRNQTELLKLSRSTKQIIASHSGHQVLLEEPQLIIDAIREMVK